MSLATIFQHIFEISFNVLGEFLCVDLRDMCF